MTQSYLFTLQNGCLNTKYDSSIQIVGPLVLGGKSAVLGARIQPNCTVEGRLVNVARSFETPGSRNVNEMSTKHPETS